MRLDKFLNSAAILFLTDIDFQKISDLAGITWSKLPELESVKIVSKYLSLRANNPHKIALSSLQDDLRFLEMSDHDLRSIGRDEEEISHQFKIAYKAHRYLELATMLQAHPDFGDKILLEFDIDRVSAVNTKTVTEFLPTEYEAFLEKQKSGKERVIIPGFEMLSKMIGGFNAGRVIMVLGETGFGKTNLAINLMIRAATYFKCLFVNMEMPLSDITNRLVVLSTQKSFKGLYEGQIPHELAVTNLKAYGNNLRFTEGFSLSLQSIESLMRKEKQRGLDFVVIDYDQKIDLAHSRNVPEWKMLQLAVQHIENVANEINVCVILLAQINRDGTISSSHRATFAAHTILNFKANDAKTAFDNKANALISAEKNRHGKKDQACLVQYITDNLNIHEIAVVDYVKPAVGVKREKSV